MSDHDDAFAAFRERRAAERAATVRVTWRRVSPDTGGGLSGLGPAGRLVYVTDRSAWPGRDGAYSYGWRDEQGRPHAVGYAPTRADAKRRAEALFADASTFTLDNRDSGRHDSGVSGTATQPEEITMTATTVKTSKRTIDQLRAAYDLTFANFATDNAEVAKALNVSAATAGRLMGKLEKAGLVCSTDVNDEAQGSSRRGQFKHLTWQCWQTYDSIDAAEAANVFDAAFGVITNHPAEEITPATPEEETSMAAPTKTSKTAQARAAREEKAAAKQAAAALAAIEPEASTSTELATIPPATEPTPEPATEPTPEPEPAATQTGAQLMNDLSAQVKRAVRGAELKASPSAQWTTVRVATKPVAYIDVRKASVILAVALPEAPKDVELTFTPDTRHNERFAVEAKVTSPEQFPAALTAIELAAARVAA